MRVYSLQIVEHLLLPPQHGKSSPSRRMTERSRSRLGQSVHAESILRWTVRNMDVDDLLVVRHHNTARDAKQVTRIRSHDCMDARVFVNGLTTEVYVCSKSTSCTRAGTRVS